MYVVIAAWLTFKANVGDFLGLGLMFKVHALGSTDGQPNPLVGLIPARAAFRVS